MMNHWFEHHGDNRRYKGHVAITTIRRSGLVLDMVDTIHKEIMIRENDMGDSIVNGWKLIRDTIEFFLYLSLLVFSIGIGFVVAVILTMVVFIMYLTDTSINFWKLIKKT